MPLGRSRKGFWVELREAKDEFNSWRSDPEAYAARKEAEAEPFLTVARTLFIVVFGGAFLYWALLRLHIIH
jgi:hypothetical protein